MQPTPAPANALPREPARPRPPRWALAALAACAAAAMGLYLWQALGLYWAYLNDDAYITFRHSLLLAQGQGAVFNLGERVEGYTNPLTMLLVAAWIKAAGAATAPLFAKVLGVVAGALSIALGGIVAASLAPAGATRVAAAGATMLVSASHANFALNSTSGLETTTYGLAVGVALGAGLLGLRARAWRGAGLAWALAYLARPEGAVVFTAWWIAQAAALVASRPAPSGTETMLARARRLLPLSHVVDGALFTAVVVAHVALRWWFYDGELVPNTYHAKIGGYAGATPLQYAWRGAVEPFAGLLGISWLVAATGLALGRAPVARLLPVVAVAWGGALFPLVSATDWMPGQRLTVPYLPLLSALWATGLVLLVARVARPRWALAVSVVALPLLLLWWQAPARASHARHVAIRAAGHANAHVAIARWLQENIEPGGAVAVMDIGVIGYLNPGLRVVDVSGLTDREIAKSAGEFLEKDYDPAHVLAREPDVVVLSIGLEADGTRPPPADARWMFWTPTEKAIFHDPAFAAAYRRPPEDSLPDMCQGREVWEWSRRLGARFARWEAYPATGRARLQVVFTRKE